MSTDSPRHLGDPQQNGGAPYSPPAFTSSTPPPGYTQGYIGAPTAISASPDGKPPLWAPWYGIGFVNAFVRFWKKYATFSGRASRSEYWFATLANFLVGILLLALTEIGDMALLTPGVDVPVPLALLMSIPSILLDCFIAATIVPNLALAVRRLHDANLSGWFLLLGFVPLVNIVVFVMTLLESNPQGARFDRPTA